MPEIRIERADITALRVDAIVNAANESLVGGGGVDGAIHAAAGPELARVAREMAPCPAGQVRVTPGFRLPARYVIHAVGPRYAEGDGTAEPRLRACYRKSLHIAVGLDLASVAFPAISCGAFGYPLESAAAAAVSEVAAFLDRHDHPPRVHLVAFDAAVLRALQRAHEDLAA